MIDSVIEKEAAEDKASEEKRKFHGPVLREKCQRSFDSDLMTGVAWFIVAGLIARFVALVFQIASDFFCSTIIW